MDSRNSRPPGREFPPLDWEITYPVEENQTNPLWGMIAIKTQRIIDQIRPPELLNYACLLSLALDLPLFKLKALVGSFRMALGPEPVFSFLSKSDHIE